MTRYKRRYRMESSSAVHPGGLPHHWRFPSPTAGQDRITGTCDCGATQSALAFETTLYDELMKHQAAARKGKA